MKKNYMAIVIMLCCVIAKSQPGFVWAKQLSCSSPGEGNIPGDITTDASGNVFITGSFYGTVDFDPGPGSYTLTCTFLDLYLAKYDPSGNFIWARNIGRHVVPMGLIEGRNIKVIPSGDIYVTGPFGGTIDFDPGPGTSTLMTTSADLDVYITKLDLNGNLLWSSQLQGYSGFDDSGEAVEIDASGNVYASGTFQLPGYVDFDPGPGTYTMSAANGGTYVLKLNSSGNFLWAKQMGQYGNAMVMDASSNICIAGSFYGTYDFDPGPGTFTMTNTSAGYNIFMEKLDVNGNFLWAKQMVGNNNSYPLDIGVDASGNIFSTGYFSGTVDFDPGPSVNNMISVGNYDIYINKLDPNGNYLWAKRMGSTNDDLGVDLAVDGSGNVISTGWFRGTVDFDPGPSVLNFSSAGNDDIYINKLDGNGNYVWTMTEGDTARDRGLALKIDVNQFLYTTGSFRRTVDFDPGPSTFALSNPTSYDYTYFQKFGPLNVGVSEKEMNKYIGLYPNPAKDILHFESSENKSTIIFLDVLGKQILKFDAMEKTQINIKELYPGIYFYQIFSEGKLEKTGKLIKE